MSNFLVARRLVKEYAQGNTGLRVLKGVSLKVREGEFVGLVGKSGAGKSTLLHLLGLLDTPTSGEIVFEGRTLTKLSGVEQARLRNRLFGFVFQFFHLLPDFTALENVMMPAMVGAGILGWAGQKRQTRDSAMELLVRLGLEERLNHKPKQLSGGECQRLAIARALINRPRILLLDEPTGNLDSQTGQDIFNLIHELNRQQGQTIVMVTHDEVTARKMGKIIRIHDGQIV